MNTVDCELLLACIARIGQGSTARQIADEYLSRADDLDTDHGDILAALAALSEQGRIREDVEDRGYRCYYRYYITKSQGPLPAAIAKEANLERHSVGELYGLLGSVVARLSVIRGLPAVIYDNGRRLRPNPEGADWAALQVSPPREPLRVLAFYDDEAANAWMLEEELRKILDCR